MTTEWSKSVNCEASSIQCSGPMLEEQYERTPLLLDVRKASLCTKFWAVILIVFLCVGVTIGTYLLYKEDNWKISSSIEIISRDSWNAPYLNISMPRLEHPIRKIRMIQTNITACSSEAECSKQLLNLQVEHIHVLHKPDIMYNFLIAANGQVYEGRGWNYVCDYKDALTIAIFGTYGDNIPNHLQLEGLTNLLELAISKKMLVPCYTILVKYESYLGMHNFINSVFNVEETNNRYRNCK